MLLHINTGAGRALSLTLLTGGAVNYKLRHFRHCNYRPCWYWQLHLSVLSNSKHILFECRIDWMLTGEYAKLYKKHDVAHLVPTYHRGTLDLILGPHIGPVTRNNSTLNPCYSGFRI